MDQARANVVGALKLPGRARAVGLVSHGWIPPCRRSEPPFASRDTEMWEVRDYRSVGNGAEGGGVIGSISFASGGPRFDGARVKVLLEDVRRLDAAAEIMSA